MDKNVEPKVNYPRIPEKNWWDLRKQANQKFPQVITPSYLASALDLGEGAAKNLIPNLRVVGLIDEAGKSIDEAIKTWRDDEKYPGFCTAALERLYPDELRSVAPPPDPDANKVMKWFMNKKAVGEAAARQMASFYALLCQADPSRADQPPPKRPPAKANGALLNRQASPKTPPKKPRNPRVTDTPAGGATLPTIQLSMQVHIAADASAEQIDQIFQSMARHIYRRE